MEKIKSYFEAKDLKVENEAQFIDAYNKLEQEKSDLEKELEDAKNALEESNKDKATALVEQAIKDGKVNESAKEKWVNMATSNYELASETIKSLVTPAQKITDKIVEDSKSKGREKWNIRDWEKKDPKGLARLKETAPETYKQMFDEYYKANA